MAEQQPKLLVQAYEFPPVQSAGTRRWYHLYRGLQPYFADIQVITADNRQFLPQDNRLALPQAKVQKIAISGSRARVAASQSASDQYQRYWSPFRWLYQSFPFVYFTGAGGYRYLRNSLRLASRLVEEEGITHVLSAYQPWADHLVAYRLKQRYPHLVWIADFRDLPTNPVLQEVWWPALQGIYQRRLLRRTDVVTTVSEGLARQLKSACRKLVVVRNGLTQLPVGFLSAPLSPHFTITYTGSLNPRLQKADLLWQLLRQLLDENEINPAHLRLHYTGKDGDQWLTGLRTYDLAFCGVDYGVVPIGEMEQLQRQSQLNVLLSWSTSGYGGIMPANLGNYLQAGRPIMAILNGPPDAELTQVVETTGGGKVFATTQADTPAALRQFVLDTYRTWQFSGALPWQIAPDKLQPYTWSQQLVTLLEALDLLR